MDVTKSVFKKLKPQIEAAIQNCSFAAIDCEFTGLVLPDPLHPLDTVAQRYQKLRAGISEYLVVQVGLSLWLFDEDKQHYSVKTFNLFTFPDAKYPHRFRNQASCLQFLVQHGFDLNRCVREGLPFLHPQDLLEQRQRLESRHIDELALLLGQDREVIRDLVKSARGSSDAVVPEFKEPPSPIESASGLDSAVKSYVQSVSTMVSQWMNKTLDQDSILLPACNDFVRTSVYRHIEKKFFDSFFQMEAVRPESGDQRGVKHIKLSRSESTPIQRLFAKQKEEKELLEERFGVSAIVKKLVDSKKPVVGHNSIRDLLHVIHQFIAPLPEDFSEFQIMCKELFPVLFDTKHMSVTGNIKSSIRGTRLIDVFNQIKNQHDKVFPIPKIHIDKGFGYDDNLAREHEAGFDAWLTGYIFAAFAHSVSPSQKNGFSKLDFSHSSFKPYLNKMHFGPSIDIPTMELDANPAAVNRNDVFVIEWKEPEDHVHARYLLSLVGGSKRCGWGEQVLAFVPSNLENCVKVMRAQEGTVNPCRLFKYQTSKQSRRRKAKSKSPNETTATGAPTSANTSFAATGHKSASGSMREHGSPQNKSWSPASTVSGVDHPKKPKLDSISEMRKASSPVRQSGPFPEASWWKDWLIFVVVFAILLGFVRGY